VIRPKRRHVQYCIRKKSRLVYDGCSVGSLFSFRECVCVRRLRRRWRRDGGRRCVFRAADGKLATLRTGSTVMRCLGGRNIDPVGPQRTSCATLQRLTTKNPSSEKKKNHLGIYDIPNKMHHRRHDDEGDFFTHKRRERTSRTTTKTNSRFYYFSFLRHVRKVRNLFVTIFSSFATILLYGQEYDERVLVPCDTS